MKLRLAIKTGSKTDFLNWNHTHCTVGRGACHLKLDDKRCSEQHLILFEDERGHLRLLDLQSTNGTKVNAEKTEACVLGVGDKINLGNTTLTVENFAPEGKPWRGLLQVSDLHTKNGKEKENTQVTESGAVSKFVPPKPDKVRRDERLVNSWPDNLQAHNKSIQAKFNGYTDKRQASAGHGRKS